MILLGAPSPLSFLLLRITFHLPWAGRWILSVPLHRIQSFLTVIGSVCFPLILTTLILQGILHRAYFPACFAAIPKLTSLSERSMMTGVILSVGVVFGMGITPFVLGVTADHFSFKTGIFRLGVLVTLFPWWRGY